MGTVRLTHFEGALCAIVDIRQTILSKLYSLVEATLVISAQVRQMDFQPPQATLTEGLSFGEEEEATREIVTDVVQMWWNGVCSTTEVHIVGKVEFVTQELESNSQRVSERE